MDKKQYYREWEEEHREERNEYRRKKYREKCLRQIESGVLPKPRKQRITLREKLKIAQKQCMLMAEHIKEDLKCDDSIDEIYNYFMEQAKEMLNDERN